MTVRTVSSKGINRGTYKINLNPTLSDYSRDADEIESLRLKQKGKGARILNLRQGVEGKAGIFGRNDVSALTLSAQLEGQNLTTHI